MRSLLVRQRLMLDGSLVVFVLFVLCAIARAEPSALAVTHVTVIDGKGGDPQPDRTILISDDRIVSISDLSSPEAAA